MAFFSSSKEFQETELQRSDRLDLFHLPVDDFFGASEGSLSDTELSDRNHEFSSVDDRDSLDLDEFDDISDVAADIALMSDKELLENNKIQSYQIIARAER